MVDSDTQKPQDGKKFSDVMQLAELDMREVAARPEFIAWAGEDGLAGGVITDGEAPAVFYHGGASGVEEFNRDNPKNTGEQQHGFYFSPRLHDARFYADKLKAEQIEVGEDPNSSVYAVCLKMKNPYVVGEGDSISSASINEIPEGYDGIVNPRSQEVVVFDPTQVFIAGEAQR